jgi:ABC-2 type transport system permease protein
VITRTDLTEIAVLARRSLTKTARRPAQVVPALIFPLFLLAVNSSGLERATNLPGFPTNSYLTFALAVPFMQGALFSVMNAGTDLAIDIESGFFNRLALTPLRGAGILAGMMAGVIALGIVQATVYLLVGLIAGAHFAAGVGGVGVIYALSILLAAGFGSLGAFFALRTGTAEGVQGMFPVLFVFLFLSSMSLPRNLIQTDWFRQIATYNPVSYLVEGIRSLLVTGWDGEALALAFGVGTAILVVGVSAASAALRTRLVRT